MEGCRWAKTSCKSYLDRSASFFHLILIDLEFSYSVIVNDPVAAVPGEDPQH